MKIARRLISRSAVARADDGAFDNSLTLALVTRFKTF